MVTREHLYLLMARCYETSQQLAGIQIKDADKNQIRNELIAYANAIYAFNLEKTSGKERDIHARMSIIVTEIMTYLIECSVNPINQELQYVVRKLAATWGIDPRTNLILFCHGDYAVRHYPPIYISWLQSLYNLGFLKQPRIVYLPREYDGDLLFSSVVFHEVGHMVEIDRSLGGKVYDELLKMIRNTNCTIFRMYFKPEYNQKEINEERVRSYIKEYIADLFGSQYLGRHILHFLDCHESLHRDKDSTDHPSFECRAKLVDSFLNFSSNNPPQTSDKFLQIIINVFHNESAIPDLCFRDNQLSEDDLLSGNRKELGNTQELFSLFSAAWRASLRGIQDAKTAQGIQDGELSRYDYYSSINNATKQSIIDYIAANP